MTGHQKYNDILAQALKTQYPKSAKKTALQGLLRRETPRSHGEESFLFQLKHASSLPIPEREQKLVPGRNWRYDFVWYEKKIVFEIEGGVHTGGRHVRAAGFENDIRKYEAARKLGYQVFRYTTDMVTRGEALQDAIELLS